MQPEYLPWVVEKPVIPCACSANDGARAHEDRETQEASKSQFCQGSQLDLIEQPDWNTNYWARSVIASLCLVR